MLSEVNWTENKYYTYMWNLKWINKQKLRSQIHRNKLYNGDYQGLGMRERWGDAGQSILGFSYKIIKFWVSNTW